MLTPETYSFGKAEAWSKDWKTTAKITDHTAYFDVMNQTFCELIARNAELEKANGELKEELAAKNQELAQIKNSKRYKFINKIGDTLHK